MNVWFFNESTGIITGVTGGSEPQVAKTINGGVSWTITTLPTSGHDFFSPNKLYFVNNNTGYLACRRGQIFKTEDQGNNWTSLETGVTEDINSIHFPSNAVGYASLGYSNKILKTINGGSTWSEINLDMLRSVSDLFFTDNNTGYLACNNSTILKTTDGGVNWTAYSFGTSDRFNTICFTSSQYGYTAGESGIIAQTADAGKTWGTV